MLMPSGFSPYRCAYGYVEKNDWIVGAAQLRLYLIPVGHFN